MTDGPPAGGAQEGQDEEAEAFAGAQREVAPFNADTLRLGILQAWHLPFFLVATQFLATRGPCGLACSRRRPPTTPSQRLGIVQASSSLSDPLFLSQTDIASGMQRLSWQGILRLDTVPLVPKTLRPGILQVCASCSSAVCRREKCCDGPSLQEAVNSPTA